MMFVEINFESDEGWESIIIELPTSLAARLEWWLVTQGVTEV